MNAHLTSCGRRATSPAFALGLVLALAAPGLCGATFTVNADGSAADANPGNGSCATAGASCTLHAAIQESNALAAGAPHTIAFSVPKVTLTANLPPITRAVMIDGGGSRTEISGGPGPGPGTSSGFLIQQPAGGTTIRNLVINWMFGQGIAIVNGGNSVQNCYIGTDTAGNAAKPNNGAGITVTTVALGPYPTPPLPPDISAVLPNNIGDPSDPAKGNLISGNLGAGIDISGERTVKTIVANNLIGTNAAGSAGIPNIGHGVTVSGNSYKNTIGPGNLICGDPAATIYDGISIQGQVWEPNVVKGNIVGASKDLTTNLGFGRNAIVIASTRYHPTVVPEVVTLGPANIIGFSGEEGVLVTSGCERVRIFGNFIGIGAPAATPTVFADIGNKKEGIRITTSGVAPTDSTTQGHLVGGTTPADRNVISANGKIAAGASGIVLSTSSATDTKIQGNVIGRDPLDLLSFPNSKDGIWISGGGNNTVGGTGLGQGNVIAGNGRNGVKITGTGTFSNLVSGNSIFGNGTSENGLGIDLEYAQQGVDPTDNGTPGQDPNVNYANYGQNAPVVSTGANAPHYDPATGNVVAGWTLDTSAATPVTLEFYTSDAPGFSGNGEGRRYLGKITTTTDGSGHAAGLSPVTPGSPLDTRGMHLTITATPTNLLDPPGTVTSAPANNTSEFSNAVQIPNPGVLQLSATTYSVGEAGVSATITVTRTGGSGGAVSVDYATSDGIAGQPGDYLPASGTLNWADGDSADKTFTVTIQSDTVFEGSETVQLTLSNPGGYAELGPNAAAVLTIGDDDLQPTISIGDVSGLEGSSGTVPFTFAVTLSNASTQTVTVSFATANGSATIAGLDYVAAAGVLTFAPGATAQPVVVLVNGDTTEETDESFFVNLSGPSNATLLDGAGQGTIQNDDAPSPTFSVSDVTQAEGNSGTATYSFTVNLTPASASAETVTASTIDGTATAADGDYAGKVQILAFPAGSTSQTFSVTVNGDAKREPDETFTVALSLNSGTTVLSPTPGTGTIQNDDPVPSITVDDVSALEGNAGPTPFTFTISLSNPTAQTVTVDYATADGTATLADADYVAKSGTLTFLPGITSQPLGVTVNGDTANEGPEFFAVNLTNGVNGGISDTQGLGSIQNDDSPTPTFSIANVSQAEGNAGTTTLTFTVSLSPAAAAATSVTATTSDGSATTADSDYVASSQVLAFPIGSTSQTFQVMLNGDTKFEPTETLTVALSTATGGAAIGGGGTATGTITGDDPQPAISLANVSAPAAGAGNVTFTFTLTLSNPSSQSVTVSWATADGTASAAAGDYVAANGTVTFPPGSTTQTFTVTITTNATSGPPKTFFVNLTVPLNATIATLQATGTILPATTAEAAVVPVVGGTGLALLSLLVAAAGAFALRRLG
jgi:hypothetical protein